MPDQLSAKTIHRTRAKESLVATIRDAIVSGWLKPGQQLKEGDLSSALGLSRTPVREALIVLEQMGLLTGSMMGRGWMVRVFTPREVHEVVLARSILEAAAARLLIQGLTDQKVDVLKSHLIEERTALNLGQYHQIKLDGWKFHTKIVELAGNRALEQCFNILRDQIRFLIIQGPASPERMQASHREHWEILGAIECKDADLAHRRIEGHFAAAEAALLANPGALFEVPIDIRALLSRHSE